MATFDTMKPGKVSDEYELLKRFYEEKFNTGEAFEDLQEDYIKMMKDSFSFARYKLADRVQNLEQAIRNKFSKS